MSKLYDLVIVGAGSAGLISAYKANELGLSVALVDKAKILAQKLRIAGGGKANITNRTINPDFYLCANKNYVKASLDFFNSQNCLDFLDQMNFSYEERKLGQIFGLEPAVNLIHSLQNKCQNIDFYMQNKLLAIQKEADIFHIELSQTKLQSKYLLLATGTSAYSDDLEATELLSLLSKLGHKIIPLRPALVPLVMPHAWQLSGLEGISVKVKISCNNKSFIDDLLFTHKGISGPASLKISCYWQKDQEIAIDFLPERKLLELFDLAENNKILVKTLVQRYLADRLVSKLIPANLLNKKLAETSKKERKILVDLVHNYKVIPSKNEGMKKAEVALGGVDMQNVQAKTLESKIIPNLFFAGEMLDITGILGGYNLHFAFASALLATHHIAKKITNFIKF